MQKNFPTKIFALLLILLLPNAFAATVQPVAAKQGMVVSSQQLASQVGVDILQAGGNAIDAAVGVGYALAVVDPCCGNIGGGGFMTIHLANGKNVFVNFREKAPLAANVNMYLDAQGKVIPRKSTTGYAAVAVPGTVMGLDLALQKYGTMTRAKVMAPAIKLARQGFTLSAADSKLLAEHADSFRKQANVAAIFLKNNQPYQAGDQLVQSDLANTLQQIADKGPAVFYHGAIADAVVQASQQQGGILSRQDFADYKVEEFTPLVCEYRGYTVISAPPPSSGGITLCETLNILEKYPLTNLGYHSAQGAHYIIEAMRYAYADRNNDLGDPDFVKNPVARLTSKSYATQIQQKIQQFRATPSSELSSSPAPYESNNTTHYSIVDKFGNAVAVTYTLDSFFGAEVIAGNTGFFLNNEMDDFTTKPGVANQFGLIQGAANSIQAGKRPLSSMTPTIVLKNNQLFMVLGSPGGPRIITSVLQVLLNVIDDGMNIQQAVNAPRFHQQWLPDVVYVEPNTFATNTTKQLTEMGYHFASQKNAGAVEAIMVDPISKLLYGASDARRPSSKAIGY